MQSMTLSLNCKRPGDPCSIHTMYGKTKGEDLVLENAKMHGMEVHGYKEESFNDEIAKNLEHFRR